MPPTIVATNDTIREIVDREINRLGRYADLNHINTTLVTNMRELFMDSNFNGIISKWDVSNVCDATCMFQNSDFSGDLRAWNVSNIRWFNLMFEDARGCPVLHDWILPPDAAVPMMLSTASYNQNTIIFPKLNIAQSDRYKQQLMTMYGGFKGLIRAGTPILQKLNKLPELLYQHGIIALIRPDIPLKDIHPKFTQTHLRTLQEIHAVMQHVHDTTLAWESLIHHQPSSIPIPCDIEISPNT